MALFTWVLDGEPGQSPQCEEGGEHQAAGSGARPCSLAPRGGSVAWRRGGRPGCPGWKALESHFSSTGLISFSLRLASLARSVLWALCLCLSQSFLFPSLSRSFCLYILPPCALPFLFLPVSLHVSLSVSARLLLCLRLSFPPFLPSFCLSSSPCSASSLSPLCPSIPLTWEEIKDLGRLAKRPGGGESRADDKRPPQRSREEKARSEDAKEDDGG